VSSSLIGVVAVGHRLDGNARVGRPRGERVEEGGELLVGPGDLTRAIRETRAAGATALFDAVVLALYQFRAVPGRKAIVVLSDGDDNHSWSDYPTLRRYAIAVLVAAAAFGATSGIAKLQSFALRLAAMTLLPNEPWEDYAALPRMAPAV